jgi:hypothetical protein
MRQISNGKNADWDKRYKLINFNWEKTSKSKNWCLIKMSNVNVPDKRSRILEVVLVRRLVTWVRGIWSGEGIGEGLRKGRSVYE